MLLLQVACQQFSGIRRGHGISEHDPCFKGSGVWRVVENRLGKFQEVAEQALTPRHGDQAALPSWRASDHGQRHRPATETQDADVVVGEMTPPVG